ncbi:MAG: DUF5717 family protein [Mobilitalea sp.]
MKEKVERFSKGDFEYELPFICLSEEEIRITVEAGKIYDGSFVISNSAGQQMKGVVYSSSRLMVLENDSFDENETKINYHFNAAYLIAGTIINGEINVVSDCGEKTIPFEILIELSFVMTSLGKIKDLFQFTNLARMDWSEAKKVFRSEDFERIFLCNEEKYRCIYRNLIKSISTSQALEEFLIAIHKKTVIRLDIDKTQVEYHITEDKLMDKLLLTKNHWGFAEIRVSTDAPFIQFEQKFLWADRFIGNNHQVSYIIDPQYLKKGNNFGHIWIKTAHQTLTVNVVCKHKREAENKISENRLKQKLEFGLIENYLSFRLNRIELMRYLEESEDMLKELPGAEASYFRDLMKAHLAIISGKNKIAEELLAKFAKDEVILKKNSVMEYCAYLYLNALYHKDEATIKHVAENIRRYYENGYFDWRILWFLLYTDKRYEKNKNSKLADIKEQFDYGCRSPILYYEAVCIYNEEPFLLRDLTEFEIQVLNFGIKNWILSKDLASQYTYLTNKKKKFDKVIFEGLVKLYDEYGTTEILSAICCMLIKGMKKSEKFFEWYRLGVEAQLRITELYEYYMYSINNSVKSPLAQPVLLYFIYNSSLNDKKKAFLYANIAKNKDKNEPIYRTYYKRMEVFATKMLEAHHISHDLATLYGEFLNKNVLSGEMSKHLPYVMYRHDLICNNTNMVSVIVMHKELGLEEIIPLTEGSAQIEIFTSNAEILLADSFGNRYAESIDYSVIPFMNAEDYEYHCIEHSNHMMLLLHLFDRYQSYRIINENAISLRKKVLLIPNLVEEYATDCYETLIDFYYENYNDELLGHYLNQINLHKVRPADRIKFLEFIVIRAFYDKAMEAFEIFGFEGIDIKRLLKLCSSWMLTPGAEKKHELMVSLCFYVFSQGKYDEAILCYLVKYYDGTTKEMFKLWQAAKGFELGTHMLEERLLIQMLFAESYIEDSFLVFNTYYKDVTNHMLVRAFLTFYAYKFLIHDHEIDEELFPVMKRELNYEENDICLLAWLKNNTTNQTLTENELIFIEYNIQRFVKKGIVLDFFLEYKKLIELPERILDKYCLTYHTDPRKQVYIHYRLLKENDQEYITECMPNIFMGIHQKDFVLFYHESLQYYITEEITDEVSVSESFQTRYDCETPEDEESKFNQINLMLMALEVKDENTLLDMMENYIKKEYMITACFQQID